VRISVGVDKQLIKIVEAVADTPLVFDYDSNGPDTERCVFCYAEQNQQALTSLVHKDDCVVVAARKWLEENKFA